MQRVVIGFVFFQRAVVFAVVLVPVVVDADQDAQHVRLEVETVGLPALVELIDFVAADAAVEDLQIVIGVSGQQLGGGEPGVAAAEGLLRVRGGVVAFAAGVGDRVALEQDGLAGADERLRGAAAGDWAVALTADSAAMPAAVTPAPASTNSRRLSEDWFGEECSVIVGFLVGPKGSGPCFRSAFARQIEAVWPKNGPDPEYSVTGRGNAMQIETLDRRTWTEAEARPVAELLAKVFPRRGFEERLARLMADWRDYQGPEAMYPRSLVIREAGRVVAHASAGPRTIGTSQGELTILALALVATDPEVRGRRLGQAVVRKAFDLVDHGPYEHSLFQTTEEVRPFYERLGCGVVTNRIVNSRGDDPAASPFSDGAVMRYPAVKAWPSGEIDLRGPGY